MFIDNWCRFPSKSFIIIKVHRENKILDKNSSNDTKRSSKRYRHDLRGMNTERANRREQHGATQNRRKCIWHCSARLSAKKNKRLYF